MWAVMRNCIPIAVLMLESSDDPSCRQEHSLRMIGEKLHPPPPHLPCVRPCNPPPHPQHHLHLDHPHSLRSPNSSAGRRWGDAKIPRKTTKSLSSSNA